MLLEISLEKRKKKLKDHLTISPDTHKIRESLTISTDLLLSNKFILFFFALIKLFILKFRNVKS